MAIRKEIETPGFVVDEKLNILIPERMKSLPGNRGGRYADSPFEKFITTGRGTGTCQLTADGELRIKRDDGTGIPLIPSYASGFDTLIARGVVGGWVANAGYSGVIDPVLSSVVSTLVRKCASWEPQVSGKPLARTNALKAIVNSNNSKHGWGDFAGKIAGGIFVDNAGICYAQLPIWSIGFEEWSSYGMTAVPIEGYEEALKSKKSDNEIPRYYYLTTTNSSLRANRMLETVDVLHIRPTGNPDWPFWIRKTVGSDYVWVLVPGNIGGHQVAAVNPHDSLHPIHGQSGVWRYMSIIVKDVLVNDENVESLIYSPPAGIVWGTGLDHPDQLADALDNHQREREEAGVKVFKGAVLGGSENDGANIVQVRWREAPKGMEVKEWKEIKEDYAAMCLGSSVSAIAQRPGRGMATNALLSHDAQAESLYAQMRMVYEGIYNWLSSDISVSVIWKSDRTTRIQYETLEVLMKAIKLAQEASDGDAYSSEEVRAMVEQAGHVDTPRGETVTDKTRLSEIKAATISARVYRKLITAHDLLAGDVVAMPNRELATVTEPQTSRFVWLSTAVDNVEVLYRVSRLRMLP